MHHICLLMAIKVSHVATRDHAMGISMTTRIIPTPNDEVLLQNII